MQTINSINLCIECINNLIIKLKYTDQFETQGFRVLNMYLEQTPYMSEIPKEQECLYSHLHVSCHHSPIFNITNVCEPRSEYDIKGFLLPDSVKLTEDTRRFIVENIPEQLIQREQFIQKKQSSQKNKYL